MLICNFLQLWIAGHLHTCSRAGKSCSHARQHPPSASWMCILACWGGSRPTQQDNAEECGLAGQLQPKLAHMAHMAEPEESATATTQDGVGNNQCAIPCGLKPEEQAQERQQHKSAYEHSCGSTQPASASPSQSLGQAQQDSTKRWSSVANHMFADGSVLILLSSSGSVLYSTIPHLDSWMQDCRNRQKSVSEQLYDEHAGFPHPYAVLGWLLGPQASLQAELALADSSKWKGTVSSINADALMRYSSTQHSLDAEIAAIHLPDRPQMQLLSTVDKGHSQPQQQQQQRWPSSSSVPVSSQAVPCSQASTNMQIDFAVQETCDQDMVPAILTAGSSQLKWPPSAKTPSETAEGQAELCMREASGSANVSASVINSRQCSQLWSAECGRPTVWMGSSASHTVSYDTWPYPHACGHTSEAFSMPCAADASSMPCEPADSNVQGWAVEVRAGHQTGSTLVITTPERQAWAPRHRPRVSFAGRLQTQRASSAQLQRASTDLQWGKNRSSTGPGHSEDRPAFRSSSNNGTGHLEEGPTRSSMTELPSTAGNAIAQPGPMTATLLQSLGVEGIMPNHGSSIGAAAGSPALGASTTKTRWSHSRHSSGSVQPSLCQFAVLEADRISTPIASNSTPTPRASAAGGEGLLSVATLSRQWTNSMRSSSLNPQSPAFGRASSSSVTPQQSTLELAPAVFGSAQLLGSETSTQVQYNAQISTAQDASNNDRLFGPKSSQTGNTGISTVQPMGSAAMSITPGCAAGLQPSSSPELVVEVTIKAMRHACDGAARPEQLLLVCCEDATARKNMESLIMQLTETQLGMVSQMFPLHVIEQLTHQQGPAGPEPGLHAVRSHQDATILFMDVVGFTTMSKEVEPHRVMAFVNELFSMLDVLVGQYGLHKVETAGDCYIVSAGVLEQGPGGFLQVVEEHSPAASARAVLAFAKEALVYSSRVLMPHNQAPTQIRIGIHTGNCTSGLVGSQLPKWSIYGDSINTASRMESTGIPGRIQVSSATHDLLPGENWEARQDVMVKGKGSMLTYLWVPQARAENTLEFESSSKLLPTVQEGEEHASWHWASSTSRLSLAALAIARASLADGSDWMAAKQCSPSPSFIGSAAVLAKDRLPAQNSSPCLLSTTTSPQSSPRAASKQFLSSFAAALHLEQVGCGSQHGREPVDSVPPSPSYHQQGCSTSIGQTHTHGALKQVHRSLPFTHGKASSSVRPAVGMLRTTAMKGQNSGRRGNQDSAYGQQCRSDTEIDPAGRLLASADDIHQLQTGNSGGSGLSLAGLLKAASFVSRTHASNASTGCQQ